MTNDALFRSLDRFEKDPEEQKDYQAPQNTDEPGHKGGHLNAILVINKTDERQQHNSPRRNEQPLNRFIDLGEFKDGLGHGDSLRDF